MDNRLFIDYIDYIVYSLLDQSTKSLAIKKKSCKPIIKSGKMIEEEGEEEGDNKKWIHWTRMQRGKNYTAYNPNYLDKIKRQKSD